MSEENQVKLSPPWYTYFNFLKYSIGKDRNVKVLDMKEISDVNYLIPVEVKDKDKARALATILVLHKNFGNIDVHTEVLHRGQVVKPHETPRNECGLIKIFEEALATNYYFEYVRFAKIFTAKIIFPVFKKEVIQFFNDDLSDLYNNFNGVAAAVFEEVLKSPINEIFIYPSTATRS